VSSQDPQRPGHLARAAARLAVALLPTGSRDRYREEWAADLDGAAGLGLSPRRVALGALAAAVRTAVTRPTGAAPVVPVPLRAAGAGCPQR
jgi:hypothetical protein